MDPYIEDFGSHITNMYIFLSLLAINQTTIALQVPFQTTLADWEPCKILYWVSIVCCIVNDVVKCQTTPFSSRSDCNFLEQVTMNFIPTFQPRWTNWRHWKNCDWVSHKFILKWSIQFQATCSRICSRYRWEHVLWTDSKQPSKFDGSAMVESRIQCGQRWEYLVGGKSECSVRCRRGSTTAALQGRLQQQQDNLLLLLLLRLMTTMTTTNKGNATTAIGEALAILPGDNGAGRCATSGQEWEM